MPPPDELVERLKLARLGRGLEPTPPLNPGLGVLASLSRILDFPARTVRGAVSGRPEATGRQVLGLEFNPPGLDFGDIAGFATELVLDPLLLIGGLGSLTKAGKAAKRGSEALGAVRALRTRAADTSLASAERALARQRALSELGVVREAKALLGRTPTEFPRSLAQQAEEGYRSLIGFGLPFGPDVASIRGLPVFKALEAVRQFVPKTRVGQVLGKSLLPRFGQDPRARPFFELSREEFRRIPFRRAEAAAEISRLKEGVPPAELGETLLSAREARGAAGRLGPKIKSLEQARDEQVQKLFRQAEERRLGARKVEARETTLRASSRARELESEAQGIERAAKRKDVPEGARRQLQSQAEDLRFRADQIMAENHLRAKGILHRPLLPLEQAALAKREAKIVRGFDRQIGELQETLAARQAAASRLVSPEGRALVEDLRRRNEALFQEEVLSGARSETNRLRSLANDYAERVLTPAADEWVNKYGRKKFFDRLVRTTTTRTGSQIRREDELVELFTAEVDDFFRETRPELAGHWFEFDPTKSFPTRYASGKASAEVARLTASILENLSEPLRPGLMSVEDLILQVPLHRFRGHALAGSPGALAKQLEKLGFAGRGIPEPIASQLLQTTRKLLMPEELAAWVNTLDKTNAVLRYSVTIPFPGFASRNLLSDTFLSFLGGGANPRLLVPAMREALQVVRGKNLKLAEEYHSLGILRGQQREILEQFGQGAATGLAQVRGVKKGLRAAGFLSELGETTSRIWHYKSILAKGHTPREAAASVRRFLLDYGELTDFERKVLRRAVFFYQWPRKVLPLLATQYLENPRRMLALTRATTQPTLQREDQPVPEFLRLSAAIPVGENLQGDPRFLRGIGSPLEELNRFDPNRGLGLLGAALSPILRVPAELAFGRDLFFNQPIIERDRAPPLLAALGLAQEQELPGGGVRPRIDPRLNYLVRQPPVGRTLSFLGDVLGVDPRETRTSQLLEATTGLRFVSLDEEDQLRAELEAAKQEIEGLRLQGLAREFPLPFLTEEGKKVPSAVQLLEQNRELRDRLRETRKRKRLGAF